ncbi:hypothetical protein ADUPG1_000796, partial [Aduncisulcus paluster]
HRQADTQSDHVSSARTSSSTTQSGGSSSLHRQADTQSDHVSLARTPSSTTQSGGSSSLHRQADTQSDHVSLARTSSSTTQSGGSSSLHRQADTQSDHVSLARTSSSTTQSGGSSSLHRQADTQSDHVSLARTSSSTTQPGCLSSLHRQADTQSDHVSSQATQNTNETPLLTVRLPEFPLDHSSPPVPQTSTELQLVTTHPRGDFNNLSEVISDLRQQESQDPLTELPRLDRRTISRMEHHINHLVPELRLDTDPLMPPTHERTIPDRPNTEPETRIRLRELTLPVEIKDGLLRDYILAIKDGDDIDAMMDILRKEAKRRWAALTAQRRSRREDVTDNTSSIPRRIESLDDIPDDLPPTLQMTLHYSIMMENIPMINRLLGEYRKERELSKKT